MAATLSGYAGKLLRVDLTQEKIWDEPLDEATARAYVGGIGLGAKILYDEVAPGVEWSDPENRLIFASGPLGGTTMGGSGTFSVITKGALTGGATSTQANGFFGAFMRFCGYDAIVVQGAASRWLYLHIAEDGSELRDAGNIMGQDSWQMDDTLKAEHGKKDQQMSVFGIGPAGENLVRLAAIAGDKGHVAGHNGTGAVMGSKKLKAIAIDRTRGRVSLHNREGLVEVSRRLLEQIKTNPASRSTYLWGTLTGLVGAEKGGWLPIKNYSTNVYDITPEQLDAYSAENIRGNFEPTPNPCWACQLHHCHMMKITEGRYRGEIVEEPEYEGFAAWGPTTGQTDVASTMVISNEVDKLGMDLNEAGYLIGLVMECYEKGVITVEDTDGLEMTWGNAEATRAMLRKVANREGFGDILAEGIMRAAKLIGGEAPNMAVHTMKGNTPRGHDHRSLWHELFDTCVSNTSTIETARQTSRQMFGLSDKGNPFDPDEVVTFTAKTKGSMQFEDALGICRFNTRTDVPILCEALAEATGWDYTLDDAMDMGRRTVNLLRAFNLRHGLGPELDKPSPRYGSTPVDGVVAGVGIGEHWDQMVGDYYEQMGWDRETSKPLPETLRSLGLEHVVADLWP